MQSVSLANETPRSIYSEVKALTYSSFEWDFLQVYCLCFIELGTKDTLSWKMVQQHMQFTRI